jgi:pilus assembly protein CpaE
MYPLPLVLVGIDDKLLSDVLLGLASSMATVESEFASTAIAIEGLRHNKAQPRLIVVRIGPECDANAIRRMSSLLIGWPILALIPSDHSYESFLQVNRAGATQVVRVPLDRDDFHCALNVVASHFASGQLDRHVIAVAGATGGSGATTIAVNLASEIAEQLHRPTILAELTLQMGALASQFDVTPRITLTHLIREIHRVDDYLVEKTLIPVAEKLRILAGPDSVHSLRPLESGDLVKIVDCLKKLSDVIVLDMPGAFQEAEFEVLKTSDQIVLVGLQSVPSIRALKALRETLPAERVVHSLWVVINRYNPDLKGFTCAEIQQMLGVPRILTVANDYNAVNLSANHGQTLREVAPSSPILRNLDGLLREILGLEKPNPKKFRNGLVGRVLKTLTG